MPSAAAAPRSWPRRPAARTPHPVTRRCCPRSACASRWARPPSSSSAPGRGRRRAAGRLGALPDLRTLRPSCRDRRPHHPVALQRLFASAMLAADPVVSGVYYVDDHFIPYAAPSRSPRDGTTSAAGRRGPRRHPRHRARRAGGVLRDRRAVRADSHAAEGAGGAEQGRPRGRDQLVPPGRGVRAGVPALPRAGRALGHLPAGAAGSPVSCRSSPRSRSPAAAPDHLGRGDRGHQGLRQARSSLCPSTAGRAADPDLRPRCVPGGDPACWSRWRGRLPQYASETTASTDWTTWPASPRTPSSSITRPQQATAAVRGGEALPPRTRPGCAAADPPSRPPPDTS